MTLRALGHASVTYPDMNKRNEPLLGLLQPIISVQHGCSSQKLPARETSNAGKKEYDCKHARKASRGKVVSLQEMSVNCSHTAATVEVTAAPQSGHFWCISGLWLPWTSIFLPSSALHCTALHLLQATGKVTCTGIRRAVTIVTIFSLRCSSSGLQSGCG